MIQPTSDVSPGTELPAIPVPRGADCPLHPPAEFATWRSEPGLRQAMYHGKPTWVVSRYQDIRAALVDPRLSAETIPGAIMPAGQTTTRPWCSPAPTIPSTIDCGA